MFPKTTRVLLVDDAISMRLTLKSFLGSIGLEDVVEAANGNEAWEQMTSSAKPIGLILCDQNMPECTGLEFLRKLRAQPQWVNLPFIFVTSETDKAVLIEAVKTGATAYLVKPIQLEDVKKKLEYAAGKVGITST